MGKKTIVISKEQASRINEDAGFYLDDIPGTQGERENGGTEVSVAPIGFDQQTTDKFAHDSVTDRGWKYGIYQNTAPMVNSDGLRESVFDSLKNFINEYNHDLVGRKTTISPTEAETLKNAPEGSVAKNALENGIDQGNLSPIVADLEKAKQKGETTGDFSTFNRKGGESALNVFQKQKEKAQQQSKARFNAGGRHIKSAPKQANNGKAHSVKDGNEPIITYEN